MIDSEQPQKHALFLDHFLANRDGIYAFIMALVRDRELTEDIFQEVSLVLWEKFELFTEGTSFGAWARQIALHKIQNERRRLARTLVLQSPQAFEAMMAAFTRAENAGGDEDWREALHHCLGKVSPASRRLLELRYFERLELAEVAARIGRTPAGVNSALGKIRAALESCMRISLAGSDGHV